MIEEWVGTINGYLWGSILIYLLSGCGIWFTLRLKGLQFTHFFHMFTLLKKSRSSSAEGISSFQALCTSLAARVGTGNLMGVAVAITLGGAGAVFWMWLIALVGMATAFAESTLGQLYKEKDDQGNFRGGPAYYMRKGLNSKTLAITFSLCLFFGYGFVFSSVQANSITSAFNGSYGIDQLTTGMVITVLAAFIIFGGLKKIARFAEITVPFMGVAYLLVCLYVIGMNITLIPNIIANIFASALGLREAGSGLVGAAIVQGVKRGLYSNEAGMGSAPNVAAAAAPNPPHPVAQGYIQMLAVFFDTIVICSCTAFLILLFKDTGSQAQGIQLTQQALAFQVGDWGSDFITIAIMLFAFTSIVGNFAYAENNLKYLNLDNLYGHAFLKVGFLAMLVFGSVATLPEVIALADLSTGLMTVFNVISLFLLTKAISTVTKDYHLQKMQGKIPTYCPSDAEHKSLNLTQGIWQKDK
ncbi:alanine/glycine:cation symporter family protein [Pseudocolwellia sp. AS88]|uniref:alanine/glycine:cation symporter family protein n=1 Tax=Pseudocolwellia sp. AS88 TaxID=3063958 RepID=UPI0026EC6213|nr:alanine/glycine:cation symporter family protein [Pseudocolwellia sp. AS88]MDO7086799.1 alanine/glycine:cation symporter family protein [Pseudocolwellia sp. AS88]